MKLEFKIFLLKVFNFFRLKEKYRVYFLAVVVGVITGGLGVIMAKSISKLGVLTGTNGHFDLKAGAFSFLFIYLSIYISNIIAPTTQGSGVPYIKLWIVSKSGYINSKFWVAKLFSSLFSLSSGMGLGREGPTVSISAGIGSSLADLFSLSKDNARSIVAMAAAGGLAGAFNTPMAAVVFTLEELLGEHHNKMLAPIMITSVVASMMSSLILGHETTFLHFSYEVQNPIQYVVYAVIGICSGLLGPLWMKVFLLIKDFVLNSTNGKILWIYPIFVFALVVGFSHFSPEVLGSGHHTINHIIHGNFLDHLSGLKVAFILFVAKFFFTPICYASGASGGIFMPTLFIGAMLGSLIGLIFQEFSLPISTTDLGPYVLVGMGAFFMAIIRAPMTSILIIFELTKEYKIVPALMLSNMISYLISSQFYSGSIYKHFALLTGVSLPEHEDDDSLKSHLVSDVMIEDVETLDADITVQEAYNSILEKDFNGFPVILRQKLLGIISRNVVYNLYAEGRLDELLRDHCTQDVITVYPDQSLLVAYEKLKKAGVSRLPVVSRYNHKICMGIITSEDIVNYFSRLSQSSDN